MSHTPKISHKYCFHGNNHAHCKQSNNYCTVFVGKLQKFVYLSSPNMNVPRNWVPHPSHCKNKLVVSTTEWLPRLQTNWRHSDYERFSLVFETKETQRQLPSSSYNHNTLKTLIIFVVHSPGYKFLTS